MIRRQERVRLIYQLRVFDSAASALLGHVIDITPDGFHLIGENPAVPHAEYSLRMDLPRNLKERRSVAFRAECKWCRRDSSGNFYSMGFRISDMTPELLETVRGLIHDFYGEDESEGDVDFNPPLSPEELR